MSNTKDTGEEGLDYLKQIDRLPEEQGRKFVEDVEKEKQKTRKRNQDSAKSYIEGRPILTYLNRLATYAQAGLETIDWPGGWERSAIATTTSGISIYGRFYASKEGVLIVVKSPKGEVFVRGIRTTGDPDMDINALDILILQAENTLDSSKGILLSDNVDTISGLRKTKNGIILPN